METRRSSAQAFFHMRPAGRAVYDLWTSKSAFSSVLLQKE